MAKFDVLRRAALNLPEVEEGLHKGGPAFRCRGRTFALWWAEGERTIMKLEPGHQTFLFEVRPEIFAACPVGVGVWSYVDLQPLNDEEIGALTKEAWLTVAPRRLSRPSG
jgi:hypothetical protein